MLVGHRQSLSVRSALDLSFRQHPGQRNPVFTRGTQRKPRRLHPQGGGDGLQPLAEGVDRHHQAAAQYWPSVPALTVPDMVPTHGALNAFGFVLCAHLAAALDPR